MTHLTLVKPLTAPLWVAVRDQRYGWWALMIRGGRPYAVGSEHDIKALARSLNLARDPDARCFGCGQHCRACHCIVRRGNNDVHA